jgi:hypothetical protein
MFQRISAWRPPSQLVDFIRLHFGSMERLDVGDQINTDKSSSRQRWGYAQKSLAAAIILQRFKVMGMLLCGEV